jgi:hypothetical protein
MFLFLSLFLGINFVMKGFGLVEYCRWAMLANTTRAKRRSRRRCPVCKGFVYFDFSYIQMDHLFAMAKQIIL